MWEKEGIEEERGAGELKGRWWIGEKREDLISAIFLRMDRRVVPV